MGGEVTAETTIVAVEDAISTTIDDEEVILNLETSTYHGLNAVGSDIWQQIQQPVTVDELVADLRMEYDIESERLRADVRQFVSNLHESGLVELRS